MIRLLFWIAIVFAAIWLWRKFNAPAKPAPKGKVDDAQVMVRCAQCGVHLPDNRALRSGNQWYCSQAHLEQGPGSRDR